MKIEINSREYQCWHEVGHAIACIYLKGEVEFIELCEDSEVGGLARARCITNQFNRLGVACGGFATEYILSKQGYLPFVDAKEFTQIVFRNATKDRDMFTERKLEKGENFTKEEDEKFMHYAINFIAPVIIKYFPKMKMVVDELLVSKKILGKRILEILNS